MEKKLLVVVFIILTNVLIAQNIGIGTATPSGKLHIKGSENISHLVIDANSTQSNTNPLIKLRRSDGMNLLWIHSDDYSNVFIGQNAGRVNNRLGGGSQNTFVGSDAGYSNTTGFDNTAYGVASLSGNTSGNENTALGVFALQFNANGSDNTAAGKFALRYNSSGSGNIAYGYGALYNNTSGPHNVAVGYNALSNNTTGGYNVAVGNIALVANTNYYNTGVGYGALYFTAGAQYNVAVGYQAGYFHNNGYNNVFLGANTDVNGAGYYNVVAVGQGTVVGGASVARFGNAATISYGGWAGWSNLSDGRFKENIRENVPGIEFINKLRPVTYSLDATRLDEFLHQHQEKGQVSEEGRAVHQKALLEKEQIIYTGFVAQEVETAARELGFDFSGVDAARNEKDTYGLRYAEFVVPLVKSVQEQQKIIEALKQEITAQLKLNNDLLQRIQKLESKLRGINPDQAQ